MDLQQALALLQPDESLHGCLSRARREHMTTGLHTSFWLPLKFAH